MVICVYCVFNYSNETNDPPSVPYFNLNNLYKIQYDINNQTNVYNFTKENAKKMELELIILNNYLSSPIYKNLYTEDMNKSINDVYSTIINLKNLNNLSQRIKDELLKIIKYIEKMNAVTSIGSLEFIDNLVKLNTNIDICEIDKNTLNANKIHKP